MARPPKLTRDERIILGAAAGRDTSAPTGPRPVNTAHAITKLQHRGMLDAAENITDAGRRALGQEVTA